MGPALLLLRNHRGAVRQRQGLVVASEQNAERGEDNKGRQHGRRKSATRADAAETCRTLFGAPEEQLRFRGVQQQSRRGLAPEVSRQEKPRGMALRGGAGVGGRCLV